MIPTRAILLRAITATWAPVAYALGWAAILVLVGWSARGFWEGVR